MGWFGPDFIDVKKRLIEFHNNLPTLKFNAKANEKFRKSLGTTIRDLLVDSEKVLNGDVTLSEGDIDFLTQRMNMLKKTQISLISEGLIPKP